MKTQLTDEQQQRINQFVKDCLKGSTTQADDKKANEVNHLFTVVENIGGVNIGFRACSLNGAGECIKYEYFVINN